MRIASREHKPSKSGPPNALRGIKHARKKKYLCQEISSEGDSTARQGICLMVFKELAMKCLRGLQKGTLSRFAFIPSEQI